MRKRVFVIIGVVLVMFASGLSISRYRYIEKRNQYVEIAEEIYRVETALKEVDEDWERNSITKISSFEIKGPDGVAGIYSCCQSTYFGEFVVDENGIDLNVIGQLVDMDRVESTQKMKVNEYDACLYVIEDQTYLCWTASPEYSFVIRFNPDLLSESNVIKMAESVPVPEE